MPRTSKYTAPLGRIITNNDANEINEHSRTHLASEGDLRWSEVVPPATGLTFAAVWDPEDGIVTFGGAGLSTSQEGGGSSPVDADSRSQVLTIDLMNTDVLVPPSAALESGANSIIFPYNQSRFALSELSTNTHPVSPTRRSSAGTGLFLDAHVRQDSQKRQGGTHVEPQLITESRGLPLDHGRAFGSADHSLKVQTPRSPTNEASVKTRLPSSSSHKHSNSQASVSTGTRQSSLGYGLCRTFHREIAPGPQISRADRYGYLKRAAEEKDQVFGLDDEINPQREAARKYESSVNSSQPRSPGVHSMFARSIWIRSGLGLDRPMFDADGSRIHFEDEEDGGWVRHSEEHDAGLDLEEVLNRDVNRLVSPLKHAILSMCLCVPGQTKSMCFSQKSTFSWTTTSTSRYIDVVQFLQELDSDTDSSDSSDGAQNEPRSPGGDSEWLAVEPPTPRPFYLSPTQALRPRFLRKKRSRSQGAEPLDSQTSHNRNKSAKVLPPPTTPCQANRGQEYSHVRCVCPQCHHPIQVPVADHLDETYNVKGKNSAARAISSPKCLNSSSRFMGSDFGRPAVQRSSSSPASFTQDTRVMSSSRPATPLEVLARSSYNHEWSFPTPREVTHRRSATHHFMGLTTTSSSSLKRTASWMKNSQQLADVRTVIRGVQSGIRPSTPVPGMPPISPPRYRPPPSSFRPVSACGERSNSRLSMPTSSTVSSSSHGQSQFGFPESASHLSRCQSQNSGQQRGRSPFQVHSPSPSAGSNSSAARVRTRTRSLDSIRDTAHILATASTAPIRSLLRARSFIKRSTNENTNTNVNSSPKSNTLSEVKGEPEGVWIRVDVDVDTHKSVEKNSNKGVEIISSDNRIDCGDSGIHIGEDGGVSGSSPTDNHRPSTEAWWQK